MKLIHFAIRQICRIAGQACIAIEQARRPMHNRCSTSEGVASVGRLGRYAARTIGTMRLPLYRISGEDMDSHGLTRNGSNRGGRGGRARKGGTNEGKNAGTGTSHAESQGRRGNGKVGREESKKVGLSY